MKERNDIELMGSRVGKSYRAFFAIICVITVLELTLTVNALLTFNLTRLKHRMYLYSYLFLFLSSFVTCVIMAIVRQPRGCHRRVVVVQTYVYAFCMLLWSCYVSLFGLHCVGGQRRDGLCAGEYCRRYADTHPPGVLHHHIGCQQWGSFGCGRDCARSAA